VGDLLPPGAERIISFAFWFSVSWQTATSPLVCAYAYLLQAHLQIERVMSTGQASGKPAHHRRPGLDLPLPVAQGRQWRDDEERPRHMAQLPLVLEHSDGLRSLAKAPAIKRNAARWTRLSMATPTAAARLVLPTTSHIASTPWECSNEDTNKLIGTFMALLSHQAVRRGHHAVP